MSAFTPEQAARIRRMRRYLQKMERRRLGHTILAEALRERLVLIDAANEAGERVDEIRRVKGSETFSAWSHHRIPVWAWDLRWLMTDVGGIGSAFGWFLPSTWGSLIRPSFAPAWSYSGWERYLPGYQPPPFTERHEARIREIWREMEITAAAERAADRAEDIPLLIVRIRDGEAQRLRKLFCPSEGADDQ